MIGDNPVNDIQGSREKINAVTLQKIHRGVEIGTGPHQADCTFTEFGEVRRLLSSLSQEK